VVLFILPKLRQLILLSVLCGTMDGRFHTLLLLRCILLGGVCVVYDYILIVLLIHYAMLTVLAFF